MKIEDIAKLKEQGFTASEIVELSKVITVDDVKVSAPAVAVTQEPIAESEKKEVEPEIDPVMAVVNTPMVEKKETISPVAPAGNADPLADILNQLNSLTKAVQAGALLNDRQPAIKTDSAEDALASVLLG